MSSKSGSSSSGGLGCGTVLFLIFVVLKLTHMIDWSWWWVTAPIWIPVGLYLLVILFGVSVAALRRV